ncbi:MAG: sulfotransferase [Candidatus Promineifilaceae bacterium]
MPTLMPNGRYIRWRLRRATIRFRRNFSRRLFRDRHRDLARAMIVAGAARSGTTWLAEIIASQFSCRIMFEPFQNQLVAPYRSFNYYQYMRPEEDDQRLTAFCQQVFSGAIRHPWIDRQVDRLLPEFRLVKEIRANLLLKWIRRRFWEVPIVFVVRHPCAVVWSRLQLGWVPTMDIAPFLSQPKLIADVLQNYLEIIQRARSEVERNAVIWCICNLVPLRQLSPGEAHVIFYEHLITQPEVEAPRLFHALGRPYDDNLFDRLGRPSMTSRYESAAVTGADRLYGWQEKLTTDEVDAILAVVEAFDMGGLYGDSALPRPEWSAGRQLAGIREG